MEEGKSIDKPNRKYKDSVFVDLFSVDEKTRDDAVISLYNALHEKKITSKEEIKFIRLENVLFRKIRNDVSFVVDDRLVVLIEHQSTINNNMPYRFLEYITAIYQIELDPKAKFEQSEIKLNAPEFYVIYNGKAPYPARKDLHISNLFKSSKEKSKKRRPKLELTVTVININHPENKDFLDSCPLLNGYKKLVERIEKYKALYGDKGYAMAIEECIKEGIEISKYLKSKMREVVEMFSAEYSYALELEASKEDGMREGIREGIKKGIREGMEKGRIEGIYEKAIEIAKKGLELKLPIETISDITGLSKAEIEKL